MAFSSLFSGEGGSSTGSTLIVAGSSLAGRGHSAVISATLSLSSFSGFASTGTTFSSSTGFSSIGTSSFFMSSGTMSFSSEVVRAAGSTGGVLGGNAEAITGEAERELAASGSAGTSMPPSLS